MSPWIDYVLNYKNDNSCSFKEALQECSKTYQKGEGKKVANFVFNANMKYIKKEKIQGALRPKYKGRVTIIKNPGGYKYRVNMANGESFFFIKEGFKTKNLIDGATKEQSDKYVQSIKEKYPREHKKFKTRQFWQIHLLNYSPDFDKNVNHIRKYNAEIIVKDSK